MKLERLNENSRLYFYANFGFGTLILMCTINKGNA